MMAVHAYRRTQTETATREQILLSLLRAARGNMQAADEGLAAGRVRDAEAHARKALDIVAELNATLDPRPAPELVTQIAAIYGFVMARLFTAANGDRAALRDAQRAFSPIAEALEQAAMSVGGP